MDTIAASSSHEAHIVTILPAFMPFGQNGELVLDSFLTFNCFAAYLAVLHFNARNPTVVPELAQLTDCDLKMTLETMDTHASPFVAIRKLMTALSGPKRVSGLVGAFFSTISIQMAALSGIYEIPQISPISQSPKLNDKTSYPFFARTTVSVDAIAKAIVNHYKHSGVRIFGAFVVSDAIGIEIQSALTVWAFRNGMVAHVVRYDLNAESIEEAVTWMKSTNVRYIYAYMNNEIWRSLVEFSHNTGILGNPGMALLC